MLLAALYIALLGLSPVADYRPSLRQGFIVVTIALVIFSTIKVQGHALTWYTRRMGRRRGQVKVLNSLVPMARRIASVVILAMGVMIILDQL